MRFRTEFKVAENTWKLSYSDSILSIGSCFSVEISKRLKHLQYKVCNNPSGITFNPASIHTTVKRLCEAIPLPEEELIFNGHVYVHTDFHGSFSHIDKRCLVDNINNSMRSATQFAKQCDCLIITLGTAFVYRLKENGKIVNNCHKLPQDQFEKLLLDPDDIVSYLANSIDLLKNHSERKLRVILSLSPVRHVKDGFVENQQSKARCLLAIHDIVERYDNVCYFPSYELLLDDLRDYRYYGRDLLHPSEEAVDYIFEKFSNSFLNPNESDLRKELASIQTALQHRPLFPESKSYLDFKSKLESRIRDVQSRYPKLDLKLRGFLSGD